MPNAHIDPSPDGASMPATPRNRAADDSAPGWPRCAARAVLPAQFALRCERRGSTHIITPSGDLDFATAPALHDELLAAESTDADAVVLDLSALSFIDSTGLRTIIQASARSNANGNRLRLLPGPPQIQRIFEITATTERLPFTPGVRLIGGGGGVVAMTSTRPARPGSHQFRGQRDEVMVSDLNGTMRQRRLTSWFRQFTRCDATPARESLRLLIATRRYRDEFRLAWSALISRGAGVMRGTRRPAAPQVALPGRRVRLRR